MAESTPRPRRTATKAAPVVEETAKPAAVKPAVEKVVESPKKVTSDLVFRRRLSQGDHGPAIVDVQKALTEVGFFEGPADGRYGTLLARAVRQFQDSKGMKPTGEVDAKTWEAVLS
jgi:peptidoglycan hydrolase-like protein with peptidoglycan-binding domain